MNVYPSSHYWGCHIHFLPFRFCLTSKNWCSHLHWLLFSILNSMVLMLLMLSCYNVYHSLQSPIFISTLPNKYSASTLKDRDAPAKSNPYFPGIVVSAIKQDCIKNRNTQKGRITKRKKETVLGLEYKNIGKKSSCKTSS